MTVIWCLEFRVNTFSFFSRHLDLATLSNLDFLLRLVTHGLLDVLNLVDNIPSLENFAKNNVLSIQPRGDCGGDEELQCLVLSE